MYTHHKLTNMHTTIISKLVPKCPKIHPKSTPGAPQEPHLNQGRFKEPFLHLSDSIRDPNGTPTSIKNRAFFGPDFDTLSRTTFWWSWPPLGSRNASKIRQKRQPKRKPETKVWLTKTKMKNVKFAVYLRTYCTLNHVLFSLLWKLWSAPNYLPARPRIK